MTENFIDGPNGRLAYQKTEGKEPTVVWLGGFQSDMTGTKATHLHAWAQKRQQSYLRFDYSGHGTSDGDFLDGCIGEWRDDARKAIQSLTQGPVILVGSSMGAWISGLLAQEMGDRLAALVLIAPAPDFTEELMWPSFGPGLRRTIMEKGKAALPSLEGNQPTVITRKLIEDGKRNLLLQNDLNISVPVRILQGMADTDVPWQHAMRFAETIKSSDIEIMMTKSGDHRLSTPPDLARLTEVLDRLCEI